jgi:carbonic anhydrase/acetyltransferase-like protein (isoleucine patch superfamily)
MALRGVGDKRPRIAKGVYVDESALLIGDVTVHQGASVWPCALLRADDDTIEVGEKSAVMDLAFLEAPKGWPVTVGKGCLISHGARLHGCVIGDGALVGIGAIVLDGASVGEGSIVAAACLVPPGKKIPPMSVVSGVPASVTRGVTEADTRLVRTELEAVQKKARKYSAGT